MPSDQKPKRQFKILLIVKNIMSHRKETDKNCPDSAPHNFKIAVAALPALLTLSSFSTDILLICLILGLPWQIPPAEIFAVLTIRYFHKAAQYSLNYCSISISSGRRLWPGYCVLTVQLAIGIPKSRRTLSGFMTFWSRKKRSVCPDPHLAFGYVPVHYAAGNVTRTL